MQIKQTPTPYDVCIVGSGAGGGAAAYVLTKAGANVVMLEAGPQWDSAKDSAMFKWPYDSPRRGRVDAGKRLWRVRRVHRRLEDRGRAVHDGPGRAVRLVSRADARRPDEPLGPYLAALRSRRLPAQDDRRAGRRLADHLRRHQAVLRPARRVRGDLRLEGRDPQRARRRLPAAAEAALLRAADQAGVRQAGHPVHSVAPVDSHQAASTGARSATSAGNADAVARRTRTSRRRRSSCRRPWRRAS